MTKKLIFLFLFLGSAIGGYLPLLWGGSALSMVSIFWSAVGGFLGIYIGFKLGQGLE